MRRPLVLLVVLAALGGAPAAAQTPAPDPPEPPVRYDADLLPPSFHAERRARVLAALPEDAVAVLLAAPQRNRENDVDFAYRPNSDLLYLTGAHEPESALLLAPGGVEVDGQTVRELLFVPERNAYTELWVGRRFGPERAARELGFAHVVESVRLAEIVGALPAGRRLHYLPLPRGVDAGSGLAAQVRALTAAAPPLPLEGNYLVRRTLQALLTVNEAETFAALRRTTEGRITPEAFEHPALREAVAAFLEAESLKAWLRWRKAHLDGAFADTETLRAVLSGLRAVKTEEEIALLRRAIDITVEAHREAMRAVRPGMHEYEVEALVEYVFHRSGAEAPGFPSIVGSGENSVILHYNTNRRRMEGRDLVVIDIGAEVHGYTADVTRTLPVDGTFSEEERAIYEIVLRAQDAGIAAAQAGAPFSAMGRAAQQEVARGLRGLGLIRSDRDVRNFFMHGTSHHLGLWVHDPADGGPLRPGAVLTVEPGIYIAPSPDVDPRWWNIGVRIEDDLLITEDGPVNLSAGAPRSVEAIEALMAQGRE